MDSEKTNDKVWRYLHGLLSAGERAAFESLAEADPHLRALLDEARRLDDTLKAVAPYADWSENQLEARILEDWEKNRRWAAEPAPRAGPRRSVEWIFRPLPVAGLGLAAALCLLLAAARFHLSSGYTAWSAPVITLPVYRGISTDAANAESAARQQELEDLARRFERGLEMAYRSARGEPSAWEALRARREWRMGLRIQSFRQGVLSVHVQAEHRKNTGLKMEWTEYFSDADAFLAAREDLETRIADALAAAAPR